MIKKRFQSDYYGVGYYTDIVDNEKELKDVPNPKKNLTIEEVVDKLNEYEQLVDFYKDFQKDARELSKENEQLKTENLKLELEIIRLETIIKSGEKMKRWMSDDAGTLIDTVTGENFDIVEELVDTLNYYEETCLKYEKTISELKDGTYKEPLPITQRK